MPVTHPRLLEVSVEAVDDVLLVRSEPSGLLLSWQSEDGPIGESESAAVRRDGEGGNSLVELSPKLDTSSGDLVNRLAKLGSHGHDSSSRLVVGLLPTREEEEWSALTSKDATGRWLTTCHRRHQQRRR